MNNKKPLSGAHQRSFSLYLFTSVLILVCIVIVGITIVDYTNAGGNIVVFPYLPDREMSQKPCTIIRDALSISPSGSETIDSPLIDVYDMKDIKCANPQITYSEETLTGAEIIARTLNGNACGFSKTLGCYP